MSVLRVENLSVDYVVDGQRRQVVDQVSLSLEKGEVLGIVGESGCGKTTVARAITRLLPRAGRVSSGSVWLDGVDIMKLSEREFRPMRWDRISMVFQGAMSVLNPVFPVGKQIGEAIRTHRKDATRGEVAAITDDLMEKVGIEPERASAYPHELSGGQRQRIVIALAMALSPDVVVADEPTTALDVVTQDAVLDQLVTLQRQQGFALVLISHDMGVIAETCDRVAVMYAGHLVELAPVREIFKNPAHPYTQGLINAIPRLGSVTEAVSIPGSPPADPASIPGCRFAPRCPFLAHRCVELPPWHQLSIDHGERCFFPELREEFKVAAALPETWDKVRERRVRTLSAVDSSTHLPSQ
jgi:peptide/nickel transport system ATP-binding protein